MLQVVKMLLKSLYSTLNQPHQKSANFNRGRLKNFKESEEYDMDDSYKDLRIEFKGGKIN